MSGSDLMNLDSFKGLKPAQAFAVLDPNSESLADGIGSSYGIIGYKGKQWSLRLRGDTRHFMRAEEDGSMTPLPYLDVIFLRQLNVKSKSFYPPGSYVDGQIGTRPLCAALDGTTPDADVAVSQATACAVCPRNVFKTAPDGRKTRDCSDYKRMAVMILPKLTKALLGAPLMEPVFLRVPAASLNDLATFGDGMAAQGFHFSSYVTRIGFNPDKPHPQMTFRALQPLADREAGVVLPMRDDPLSLRITGEADLARPRPAAVAAPQAPLIDTAAVDAAAAKAKAAQVEADRVAAHSAKVVADAVAATKKATPEDLGFGDVTAPVTGMTKPEQKAAEEAFGFTEPEVKPAAVMANTDADVGPAEVTDDDLDARIAGILGK